MFIGDLSKTTFISEVPSVSVVKAIKNYWEIIFTVGAGATIMASLIGLGIVASFSIGIAASSTLGLWVALKKYEEQILNRSNNVQNENKIGE